MNLVRVQPRSTVLVLIALLGCLSLSTRVRTVSSQAADPPACASADNVCTQNNIHRDNQFTHLCVRAKVVDGRLKVDRDETCFYTTDKFNQRLNRTKLPMESLKKKVFDRVDVAFVQAERLLYYALNPNERETLGKQPCAEITDPTIGKLCAFNGTWENFTRDVRLWRPDSQFVIPDSLLFAAGVSPLSEVSLDLLEFRRPEDSRGFNGDQGRVLVVVADPIGDWNTPEYKICISGKCDDTTDAPRTVASPKDIRKILKPLVGRLWDPTEITGVVQEYYSGKGLMATVEVGSAFDDEKTIDIKESPRLLSLNFPRDMDRSKIDKAVYLLLPDRQFRRYRKCHKDFEPPPDSADPRLVVEIKKLQRKGACGDDGEELDEDLPYLNLMKLQLQKLQLNSMDLEVDVGATVDEGEQFVFLQVSETAEADEKKEQKGEDDKAVALPNEQGRIDPNLTQPESQTSFVPRVAVFASPTPTPTPTPASTPGPAATPTPPSPEQDSTKKQKRNYLGGGFDYSSGEGISLFGIYQRTKLLFGNDGLSLKVGGHDEPLGSLNYYADYVGFSLFARRITLQLTGASELQAQRIFNNTNTAERRTGAVARAEMELFRDRGGSLLRFSLEAQHMTVQLAQDNKIVDKQNLSTIDFGALYLLQADYERSHPRWARVEPRVRFGLGLAHNEPRFKSISMSGNFHQKLPGFFEVDIAGRFALASKNTPVFEQATLGGAESVRGFRQDEAIGRKMWSLQNELWIPVPGTINSVGEFKRFLLRSVRFSAFADVGGVYKTVGSQPGLRFAPGGGLRFIFNPIVIKADWAYGLSSVDMTTGRGRFSFSIVSSLPF